MAADVLHSANNIWQQMSYIQPMTYGSRCPTFSEWHMAADVLHSANDILDIHLTDWRRTYLIIKANYVRKPRNVWFGLWCLRPLSNNISVISLWKVFFSGGNRRTRKNHPPVASHWKTLSHDAASSRNGVWW